MLLCQWTQPTRCIFSSFLYHWAWQKLLRSANQWSRWVQGSFRCSDALDFISWTELRPWTSYSCFWIPHAATSDLGILRKQILGNCISTSVCSLQSTLWQPLTLYLCVQFLQIHLAHVRESAVGAKITLACKETQTKGIWRRGHKTGEGRNKFSTVNPQPAITRTRAQQHRALCQAQNWVLPQKETGVAVFNRERF